jgi:hypothetical protein
VTKRTPCRDEDLKLGSGMNRKRNALGGIAGIRGKTLQDCSEPLIFAVQNYRSADKKKARASLSRRARKNFTILSAH